MAGGEYQNNYCSTGTERTCYRASVRVMVFKTDKAAQAYWKQSCPGCGYRKNRAGFTYWRGSAAADPTQPTSLTNYSGWLTVVLCKNLVIPIKGSWWPVTSGGEVTEAMIDAAVSAGMSPCDPLKQEPSSGVFARGTAQDRGKAVAVGTVKSPSHIYLRIRSTTFSQLYVEWTLTCTNGTRSETTSDRGTADAPLEIPLRIGIAAAKSCSASASAVSSAPSNYEVKGTTSVELLNMP